MKEYEFETYSRGLLIFTVIIWVAITVFSLPLTAKLDNTDIGEFLFFVVIGVWILILYLFLRYVLRKDAKLTLKENLVIINKGKHVTEIKVSDIESYKYRLGRDSKLTFYLRDGFDISLYSNDMFCQNEQLELFCKDFDLHLETISEEVLNNDAEKVFREVENELTISPINSDLRSANDSISSNNKANNDKSERTEKPKKLLSFYDKKWALPVLVILSIVGFGFPIYVYFDGGRISGVIIASISGLIAMWGAYYKHNEK